MVDYYSYITISDSIRPLSLTFIPFIAMRVIGPIHDIIHGNTGGGALVQRLVLSAVSLAMFGIPLMTLKVLHKEHHSELFKNEIETAGLQTKAGRYISSFNQIFGVIYAAIINPTLLSCISWSTITHDFILMMIGMYGGYTLVSFRHFFLWWMVALGMFGWHPANTRASRGAPIISTVDVFVLNIPTLPYFRSMSAR